jgi:hypothetical protein
MIENQVVDRAQLWQQLAAELGGTFVPDFWRDNRVVSRHRLWTIALDVRRFGKGLRETRMRARFISRDKFKFTIYPRGVLSTAGKWLGMQDIEIGHARFDDEFIIQGNDPAKIRDLFANEQIRFLIESSPTIYFSIMDQDYSFWTIPPGVDELCLTTPEDLSELVQLKLLFELFAATLDELERLGTLLPDAPQPPAGEE